jgi:hypothetical protein
MAFLETQAVRAVLAVIAMAAIFAGMTLAGLALFLALMPYMHPAWAALIAASVLIVPVVIGAFIVRSRAVPRARPQPAVAAAATTPDDAAMQMIAGMANEKPLLAVLFAGLLGAAGTILQHRVQQKGRVN